MKLNEYQEISKRTMPDDTNTWSIVNYALGLCAESGEVGDLVKKEVFHGHECNPESIKKELGDVLHYLSGLASMYGFTLEEVATANIEKLMLRYPNGFSTSASINRTE